MILVPELQQSRYKDTLILDQFNSLLDNKYLLLLYNTQVFPVGVNVVEDLAVDWIGGNLYWNDYVFETIEVSKLDGTAKTVLFSQDITNPRGIEVDPRNG